MTQDRRRGERRKGGHPLRTGTADRRTYRAAWANIERRNVAPHGNWNPNETPEDLAERLKKIEEFVREVNTWIAAPKAETQEQTSRGSVPEFRSAGIGNDSPAVSALAAGMPEEPDGDWFLPKYTPPDVVKYVRELEARLAESDAIAADLLADAARLVKEKMAAEAANAIEREAKEGK